MAEQLLTLEQVEQLELEAKQQQAIQGRQFESEANKFSEFLLEDNLQNIPPKLIDSQSIAKAFWAFFDKDIALSNFEPEDIKWLLFKLDIVKLDTMMQFPDYKLTFADIQQLDQMSVKAFAKMKRATGGINRERALIASQIRQFLTNESEAPKGGIFSGIGKLFRGKK